MKLFQNILCVLDEGDSCRATLERAVSLAENNQARLTVAAVVPPLALSTTPAGGHSATEVTATLLAARQESLAALTAPHSTRVPLGIQVLTGTGFLEVIRAVLRDGYDLVIKAAQDPKFIARLFGSDDMHLLRKCPCPVWLTKPGTSANYAHILAAVDVDLDAADAEPGEMNRHILELAGSLALSDFAALHLVHAWQAPAEATVRAWSDDPAAGANYVERERVLHQRGLDRMQAHLHERMGPEVFNHLAPQAHLRRGAAAEEIPALARELNADLVVMGTVGRAGIPGLFIGNTAEAILEQLQCSVLAIKPTGFVSPVR